MDEIDQYDALPVEAAILHWSPDHDVLEVISCIAVSIDKDHILNFGAFEFLYSTELDVVKGKIDLRAFNQNILPFLQILDQKWLLWEYGVLKHSPQIRNLGRDHIDRLLRFNDLD